MKNQPFNYDDVQKSVSNTLREISEEIKNNVFNSNPSTNSDILKKSGQKFGESIKNLNNNDFAFSLFSLKAGLSHFPQYNEPSSNGIGYQASVKSLTLLAESIYSVKLEEEKRVLLINVISGYSIEKNNDMKNSTDLDAKPVKTAKYKK